MRDRAHGPGRRRAFVVILSAASFMASPAGAQALRSGADRSGTIQKIKVHGQSLEGNLEGDPAERDIFVYLPSSYLVNLKQRYPVLYLLHGYGRVAEQWVPFIGLLGSMDNGIAKGTTKEMIVVIPDANTKYGGSMYSSSPTTGDWEAYVTHDLVSYIDSHYRTLASRKPRLGWAFHGRLRGVAHCHEAPGTLCEHLCVKPVLFDEQSAAAAGQRSATGHTAEQWGPGYRCGLGRGCGVVAQSEESAAVFRSSGCGWQATACDRGQVGGEFPAGHGGSI